MSTTPTKTSPRQFSPSITNAPRRRLRFILDRRPTNQSESSFLINRLDNARTVTEYPQEPKNKKRKHSSTPSPNKRGTNKTPLVSPIKKTQKKTSKSVGRRVRRRLMDDFDGLHNIHVEYGSDSEEEEDPSYDPSSDSSQHLMELVAPLCGALQNVVINANEALDEIRAMYGNMPDSIISMPDCSVSDDDDVPDLVDSYDE